MDEQTKLNEACRGYAPHPRARSVRATAPWCTPRHIPRSHSITASTCTVRPSDAASDIYGLQPQQWTSKDDGNRHLRPARTPQPAARTKSRPSRRSETLARAHTLALDHISTTRCTRGIQPRAGRGHFALAARAAPAGTTDRLTPSTRPGRRARPVRARPRQSGPPRPARVDDYGLQRVRADAARDVPGILGYAAYGISAAADRIPAAVSGRSSAHGVPAVFGVTAHGIPAVFCTTAHGISAVFGTTAHGIPAVT